MRWILILIYESTLQFIQSLDAKEIYAQVLKHLPDLEMLTRESFEVRSYVRFASNTMWTNISSHI